MKKSPLSIKLIVISCLTVFTIASCKKSSSTTFGGYNISYSIQGIKVTDTSVAEAIIATGALGQTVCGLSASNSDNTSGIAITVLSNSALSTSITYTDSSSTNRAGFQINSSGKILGVTPYANTPDVKVNFTDITSTYVKGTFSGNIAATAGGASMSVTNGTFYLPVVQ